MQFQHTVACIIAIAFWPPSAAVGQTAFQATTGGATCTQNTAGSRYCLYKVGKDLEFSITAVGEPNAGISFLRSSISGDFFARMGLLHRCVIVVAGEQAPEAARTPEGGSAFVSARTGLVYRTWQECERAT